MNRNEKIARMLSIITGISIIGYLISVVIYNLINEEITAEDNFKFPMPVLLLLVLIIGLAHLLFGIKFKKIIYNRLIIHLIISTVCLVFLLSIIFPIINFAIEDIKSFSSSDIIRSKIELFVIIFIWLMIFLVPQIIIGINLYKAEHKKDKIA